MIASRMIACRIPKQSSKFCPLIMAGERRRRRERRGREGDAFALFSRASFSRAFPRQFEIFRLLYVIGSVLPEIGETRRFTTPNVGNKVWKLVRRIWVWENDRREFRSGTNLRCRDKWKWNWNGIVREYGWLWLNFG